MGEKSNQSNSKIDMFLFSNSRYQETTEGQLWSAENKWKSKETAFPPGIEGTNMKRELNLQEEAGRKASDFGPPVHVTPHTQILKLNAYRILNRLRGIQADCKHLFFSLYGYKYVFRSDGEERHSWPSPASAPSHTASVPCCPVHPSPPEWHTPPSAHLTSRAAAPSSSQPCPLETWTTFPICDAGKTVSAWKQMQLTLTTHESRQMGHTAGRWSPWGLTCFCKSYKQRLCFLPPWPSFQGCLCGHWSEKI